MILSVLDGIFTIICALHFDKLFIIIKVILGADD